MATIYIVSHPKPDSSWSWKTICKVRLKFAAAFSDSGHWLMSPTDYSPTQGYQWVRKKQPVVGWEKHIWNSWCIPKHIFINWLIVREALMLKDRLLMLGIVTDNTCFLCDNGTESHVHLFRQCVYTKQLMHFVSVKLRIHLPDVNLLEWIQVKPWAKVKKLVVNAWIQAVYYMVWFQRNKARIEGAVMRPEFVMQQLSSLFKFRSVYWLSCIKRTCDEDWLKSITI